MKKEHQKSEKHQIKSDKKIGQKSNRKRNPEKVNNISTNTLEQKHTT